MDFPEFEDTLEILGLFAGLFIVVAGVGTLISQPWATAGSTTVAVVQLVGILTAVAIGVITVAVTQRKEIDELLAWS